MTTGKRYSDFFSCPLRGKGYLGRCLLPGQLGEPLQCVKSPNDNYTYHWGLPRSRGLKTDV